MAITAKRVGLYSRVSTTKDQTTENQTLDLKKYCEARGWSIAAECADEGVSGSTADRPGLMRIMGLARKRKLDVILVWRFDRFARSLPHLVNSLEELRQLGVDFVSYQEAVDTTTAQGRLVFGIMATLSEFERSLIADRVMAGLRRAKAAGTRLGRPRAKVEAAKVAEMRGSGQSFRQIAKAVGLGKTTIIRILSRKP